LKGCDGRRRLQKGYNGYDQKSLHRLIPTSGPRGTRGQFAGKQIETAKKGKGRGYTGKPQLEPPVKVPTDADRGVGKRQAASARKLASLGRAKRKKRLCRRGPETPQTRSSRHRRSICPGEYPSVRAAARQGSNL
jgi:hypothetical protein